MDQKFILGEKALLTFLGTIVAWFHFSARWQLCQCSSSNKRARAMLKHHIHYDEGKTWSRLKRSYEKTLVLKSFFYGFQIFRDPDFS